MKLRALAAEFTGSAFLAATVIGSGIAAQNLSGGNVAIALLANAIATGCILFVIISLFARLSGAHFNPAVSIAFAGQGELPWRNCLLFIVSQTAGMIFGVALAHAMFDLPVLQVSTTNRVAFGTALGEAVATFGLVLTIFGLKDRDATRIPAAVALYITGAYWFTSSTSFANPAITIARSLSDTFAGIAPSSATVFIVCQLAGLFLAVMLAAWFWPAARKS
ncbi:MAG: aquaporin family protein [Xanthobacteraceae bacterium]|nr:aquaporin family protein [Xanthobacteraceae bacterium]QYK45949.1 MAG: aquaporin family protein [Xanthobacteraceae bacterium]